jgi:hypothetical protein
MALTISYVTTATNTFNAMFLNVLWFYAGILAFSGDLK